MVNVGDQLVKGQLGLIKKITVNSRAYHANLLTVDLNKVLAQCRDAGMNSYMNNTELKEKVLFIRNLDVKAIMKVNI